MQINVWLKLLLKQHTMNTNYQYNLQKRTK